MGKRRRAVIYARTSKGDQVIENQLLDLRRYAKSRSFILVEDPILDEDVSSRRRKRPGMSRVMELARKKVVDVVLVWHFDRFARSLLELCTALEEFMELDVAFISYEQGIDYTTPAGRLQFQMIAAFAEFERSMIRARVMAGLRRAKAQGKVAGRRKRYFDIAEARRLKGEGKTFAEISKLLGVPTSTIHRRLQKPHPKKGARRVEQDPLDREDDQG